MPAFLALVRAFLARFFENEITAGAHDLKAALFWLIALLAIPGAVAPALLGLASLQTGVGPPDPSTWGWAMIARYEGVEVLRQLSRADKTLYLGFAMMAAGILSAVTWSGLLVDRRDGLVLGVLPVRPFSLIGAKLAAIVVYVCLVSVAMHGLASMSFGSFLAASNTVGFALRGILAHFVASCAAGAFVCLSVVAIQGLTLAIVGPRAFTRVSPILQAALVGLVVLGLVTLPVVSASVVDTLKQSGAHARPWILLTPPLWFLGLYEWVLGTSDPVLLHLASTAGLGMAVVLATIAVAYPLACRRLLVNAVEHAGGFGRVGRWAVLARLVALASGRQPEVRAVSQYFLSTIGRVGQHRFVLAIAIGAATAWGLPSWMSLASALPPEPRIDLLSLPITAMLFVLVGLRLAASLPSDLPAAWVFEVHAPSREDIRQALERTMFAMGVVPVALLSATVYGYLWGWQPALLHAGCALAIGAALTEAVLWRFDAMPCATPWEPPSGHLRKWWPAYLFGFAAITRGLPVMESGVLALPQLATLFMPFMIGLAWLLRQQSLTPRPVGDGESAQLLTSALRVGRGVGDLADEGRFAVTPSRARRQTPPQPLFDSFKTLEGEERWFDGLADSPRAIQRELGYAVRRLLATPVFTSFAIVSLGLGIGATTAAYSVFHSLLWSQPEVRDANRVVLVDGTTLTGRGRVAVVWSWPDFIDVRDAQSSFSGLAAATRLDQMPLIGGPVAMPASGEAVNGDYFNNLGITPVVGRLIQPQDDRAAAPPVVVLNGGFWRRYFHADPAVVGTTVTINDRAFEVIGVAPAGYRGLDFSIVDRPAIFWVPLSTSPVPADERANSDDRDRHRLFVRGRLQPGKTTETATTEIAAIGRRVEAAYPSPRKPAGDTSKYTPPGRQWTVADGERKPAGWTTTMAVTFIGAVAIVLLVACTNLANLSLARGSARAHEVSVRKALGATRGRLVREQLIEGAIIAAAGSGVAFLTLRALVVRLTGEVAIGPLAFLVFEPRISVAVLVASAALAGVALVVIGLVPALELSRRPVREALATGGGTTPPRWSTHRAFIAWQVAATVALLLVAAACVRVLVRDVRADTGVDLERLASVHVDLTAKHFDDAAAQRAIAGIVEAVSHARPDIDASAATTGLPFDAFGAFNSFSLTPPERRPSAGASGADTRTIAGTSGLFRALGVRIVRGRGFDARDRAESPRVGVINESFARRLFRAGDALGREVVLWKVPSRGEPSVDARLTIVGLAADTDIGRIGNREGCLLYVPIDQRPGTSVTVAVRTSGDPGAALESLQAVVRRVAPDAVMSRPEAGIGDLAGGMMVAGFVGKLAGGLGGAALLLAMTGLYGVMSLLVSRRMREMGVRMALGAGREGIMRLVLLDGLKPVGHGLAIGLALGAVCRPVLQASFGLPIVPVDPVSFLLVPAPLVVAALAACYLPARRAAGVDPNTALRDL